MAGLPTYADVLDEHRARLRRVAEQRGVARIRSLYERVQEDMVKRASARVSSKASFTAQVNNVYMAQVKQGIKQLNSSMGGELIDLSKEAQREALGSLANDLTRLERKYTGAAPILPIEQAATIESIVGKRTKQLDTMHQKLLANYGGRIFDKIGNELAVSMASGETTYEATERLQEAMGNEMYQAERIARTESAWAYNAAHADGVASSQKVLPDIMQRWNELVDDDTNEPLDDRVGVDSIAMHGQLAAPGDVFTMPPTTPDGEPVSAGLVGKTWSFPPNRPNDRSVLSPWRPDWGIPGWVWRNGRRIQIAQAEDIE